VYVIGRKARGKETTKKNGALTDEQWFGRDLKGEDGGTMVLSQYLTGKGVDENYAKFQQT
jgi:hypothetical protein